MGKSVCMSVEKVNPFFAAKLPATSRSSRFGVGVGGEEKDVRGFFAGEGPAEQDDSGVREGVEGGGGLGEEAKSSADDVAMEEAGCGFVRPAHGV